MNSWSISNVHPWPAVRHHTIKTIFLIILGRTCRAMARLGKFSADSNICKKICLQQLGRWSRENSPHWKETRTSHFVYQRKKFSRYVFWIASSSGLGIVTTLMRVACECHILLVSAIKAGGCVHLWTTNSGNMYLVCIMNKSPQETLINS